MSTGRQVTYSRDAVKALRSIDAAASKLIRRKVERYADDPASLANNVKALKGANTGRFRLRVGDYRVIFTETLVVVAVLDVGHRKDVYD